MQCNRIQRNKITIIGNTGVGKTSIITQFHKKNTDSISSTIGAEYTCHVSEENNIALEIWDTAGQERFRSMITSYFRNAHACILVFDITQKKTFDDINFWYEEIKKYNKNDDLLIYLVANKVDLIEDIKLRDELDYAKSKQMRFVKTSIKIPDTIDNLFKLLISDLVEINKNKEVENNISVTNIVFDKISHNNSSCCSG